MKTKTPMEMAQDTLQEVYRRSQEEINARRNAQRVPKIEALPEEILDQVMDWAQSAGVDVIREKLKGKGYIVGRSTLSRYLRARRQEEAAESRQELAAAAKELALKKDGAAWRVGRWRRFGSGCSMRR